MTGATGCPAGAWSAGGCDGAGCVLPPCCAPGALTSAKARQTATPADRTHRATSARGDFCMPVVLFRDDSIASVSPEAAVPPALSTLSDDERLFHDSVLDFASRDIRPRVREMDERAALDPGLLTRLFDLGVMGVEIPDGFGGAGATFFHSVLAVEALSRVDPAVGVLVDVQNTLVVNALLRWGAADQQRQHLSRLARDTVGAYALSEAGSGSDAFALTTRATARGDGFVIDGRKLWITNAAEAGIFIVFATVDPTAGYKGITAFLVDRDMP